MPDEFKSICVVGLGYIGLPTAAKFAESGFAVTGVDISETKISELNGGKLVTQEPGLGELVMEQIEAGMLQTSLKPVVADAYILAVPTPLRADKTPELKHLYQGLEALLPVIKAKSLIIIESTVPVGTTRGVYTWIAQKRPDLVLEGTSESLNINLAYCPERVIPGNLLQEIVENDRVVGGISEECTSRAVKLYEHFVAGECLGTEAAVAELVKLAENSYRDVNIAFANELSMIAHDENLDIWEVIKIANRHPRVNILQPGCGVGGHCIALDPWFLASKAPARAPLISQARRVNDSKPKFVVSQVTTAISGIERPTVACLGIAFKPNVDDLRESPALDIAKQISKLQVQELLIAEPNIDKLPEIAWQTQATLVEYDSERLLEADVIVALVKHSQFINLAANSMPKSKLLDFANVFPDDS
ncbi:MAG: UDP-N-acetyl-D-mannosamine dehydrogenase [Pseudomonadota bacterium]|nr:UDP-N-acetyl-D-mannosamine dehydrogenase [Pseudomonadota bacterium]